MSFSYLRIFNWTVNPTLLCFRRLFPNRTVSSLMRAEIYYPISELYISLSVCCFSSSLVTQTALFPHYFTAEFHPAPPHSTVLSAPPQDAPWPSCAPFPLPLFEMPTTRHCSAILQCFYSSGPGRSAQHLVERTSEGLFSYPQGEHKGDLQASWWSLINGYSHRNALQEQPEACATQQCLNQ